MLCNAICNMTGYPAISPSLTHSLAHSPGSKCIILPTQSPSWDGKYGENEYGSPAIVADVQ